MSLRNILLPVAMLGELALLLYCLFGKTNHTPAGWTCAGLLLALLVCTGWLLLFPKAQAIAPTGAYSVARVDAWWTDEARAETYAADGALRELPVAVWYPADCETLHACPAVLFSHGSFGVKESNETLCRELASHGYVVCAVDHTYQCFSTRLANGRTVRLSGAFMREVGTDDPRKRPEQSIRHFQSWMDIRVGDLSFALEQLRDRAGEGAESPYDLIDPARVAVIGHSLGGSAALGMGRREDVAAVISLEAPFLCDIQAVDAAGGFVFDAAPYHAAVLNVYSDASWPHLKEWKQYRRNAELLAVETERVQNVHMEGVGHFGLTDLSLTMPFLTELFDGGKPGLAPRQALKRLNEICLTFLENHL